MIHNSENTKLSYGFKFYMPIAVLFVVLLLLANLVVEKLVAIGGGLVLTVGDFLFPLVYILDGILTEVYGYAASRRVIWMALACNILMVIVLSIAIVMPAAPNWPYQQQFTLIFGRTLQVVIASVVAFLIGEFCNSYILAKLKVFMRGKWLWLRALSSLAIGQGLDTALFCGIAFWGVLSWRAIFILMATVYCFKLLYEIVFMPAIYFVASLLKRIEHVDIYDKKTDFNPFRLK